VKLATVQAVLERVSINPGLSGAVTSSEAALEAATVLLASMLETVLELTEVTDYYSPGTSAVNSSANLYLSRMLVAKDEILTIGYKQDDGSYTDIAKDSYSVDPIYGIISLDSIPSSGRKALMVKYVSGFEGETDDRIPSWLTEAAITAAVYIMHTQVAAHGKQDILDISPEYRRLVYVMIQQYLRPRMNCMFVDTSDYEAL